MSCSDEDFGLEDLEDEENLEFTRASNYVQFQSTTDRGKKLDDQKLLILYGLYKVGTIGPNKEPQPSIFNMKGRSKWSAWKNVSNMTIEEAKRRYVDRVKEYYSWDPKQEENKEKCSANKSMLGGNVVSSFAIVDSGEEEEIGDSIFDWVKDNECDKIKAWLQNKDNDLNIQDGEQRTLLHWASDRGNFELCQLLLRHGADPKITDLDDQTPLDYAKTCEYDEIINLINSFNISNR